VFLKYIFRSEIRKNFSSFYKILGCYAVNLCHTIPKQLDHLHWARKIFAISPFMNSDCPSRIFFSIFLIVRFTAEAWMIHSQSNLKRSRFYCIYDPTSARAFIAGSKSIFYHHVPIFAATFREAVISAMSSVIGSVTKLSRVYVILDFRSLL